MNKKFTYILTSLLLMINGMAMAQSHVTVRGNVFGGGNLAEVGGNCLVTINVTAPSTGNNIGGDVYGGGALAHVNVTATTSGSTTTYSYTPNTTTTVTLTKGTVAGDVYGGGLGQTTPTPIAAKVYGPVQVNFNGGQARNVFGCNNLNGAPQNTVTVDINNGTVTTDVFGGGNLADATLTPVVNINGGTVGRDVYGGGALANVGGSTVNVLGGTVTRNVYGGGLGDDTHDPAVNGVVTVNIGAAPVAPATVPTGEATINGSVYGCNNANGTPTDNVTVNIYKTAHIDNVNTVDDAGFALYQVFGGGNQANYEPDADKAATVHIWTCDNTIQYVYGGGNAADLGTSSVNSETDVIIDGGRIEWVFGGGNGYSSTNNHDKPFYNTTTNECTTDNTGEPCPDYNPGANINGNTNVTFHAGDITYIFGGSNQYGNVSGTKTVDILSDGTCTYDNHIAELYGGSNEAPTTGDVSLTMGCPDNLCEIGSIFGGSRNANISGDVTLTIIGGQYDKVFGGNNIGGTIAGNVTLNLYGGTINSAYGGNNESGAINGKITVNVLDDESMNGTTPTCPLILHNVYGGGYDAPYNPSTTAATTGNYPEVNIIHGTVSTKSGAAAGTTGNVFGGGYGTTAVAQSNPNVRVGYDDATMSSYIPTGYSVADGDRTAVVQNNVYGGGDMAAVAGSTTVTLQHANSTVANLFGGGNQASVGNATVNVDGGAVSTGVYGGCNTSGSVGGDIAPYTATLNTTTNTLSQPNTAGSATNYTGTVLVNVTDGTIGGSTRANIHGGGYGHQTSTTGDVTVTFGSESTTHSNLPTLTGDLYGGSALGNVGTASSSTTTVNVINGKIIGDVYGGGLGNNDHAAAVNGDVVVNLGKTISGTLYNTAVFETYNTNEGGNVFGCNNANGAPTGDVQVNVNGNVAQNVFGGGNLAAYTGTPDVNIESGTVSGSVFGGGNEAGVGGGDVAMTGGTVLTGIYGGCNTSGTVSNNIVVSLTGGTIGAAAVGNPGETGYVAEQRANVHGGGYGQDTKTGGNVEVTIDQQSGENPPAAPVIWGDVYGGSALGSVNSSAATPAVNSSSHTYVTLNKGHIHGDIYGGGLGQTSPTSIEAKVWSPVQVTVNGGTVTGSIYGCNNVNGAPQSTVKVDIYGTDIPASGYALANVFGGGNLAAYGETPEVTIHNCDNSIGFVYGGGNAASVAATNVKVYGGNTIGYVFGGGNGEGVAANFEMVSGNAVAYIYGGTIDHVFGGNNSSGAINGSVTLNINKQAEGTGTACAMKIGEVYGGGNYAAGKAGTINIGCTGDLVTLGTGEHYGVDQEGIRYVYGGANQAGINNNIVLNINSGIIENVFGGNNTSGSISGTITVNIEKNTSSCDWYVGNVYGGGNLAFYSPTTTTNNPAVNILNGTVSGDVFGGGLGASAKVRSNPVVTVGDPSNNAYEAIVSGNVYGGGSAAMVGDDNTSNPSTNNTTVLIQKSNSQVTKVFGGGKEAGVTGTTGVTITDGTINGGVYGGCDSQGNVNGKITVDVKGGTFGSAANLAQTTPVTVDVYGGGYGASTTTSGDVEVNIGECTSTNVHTASPSIYGDVYGGSAFGSVNSNNTNTTTVNVMNGQLFTEAEQKTTTNGQTYYIYHGGNVYGGGLGDRAGSAGHSDILATENGKIIVNIGASGSSKDLSPDSNIGQAMIGGNVYGCNNTNGSPQDDVTVNIYRTYRTATDEFDYSGTDPLTFALNDVFGGGNQADYCPTATGKKSSVLIYGCYNTIDRVFGGSNAAASGTPASGTNAAVPVEVKTDIAGGRFGEVFGGGNGEVDPANIFGNVNLGIHGGLVDEFYVGSNQQGSITGQSNVVVNQTSGCQEITITEFYCGGKYADFVGDIKAIITCNEGMNVTNLYGGCKEANVVAGNGGHGNVHLVVKGGTYENVYGGSKGYIDPANPSNNVPANIEGNIILDIFGGTVTNAVYGGSNILGNVAGTITVNVYDSIANCALDLNAANIYGGGNQADYTAPTSTPNYPQVNIKKATVKNVFGGGLKAEVKGNPQIKIKEHAKVLENVYGGGNLGKVEGNPKVIVNGKDKELILIELLETNTKMRRE